MFAVRVYIIVWKYYKAQILRYTKSHDLPSNKYALAMYD